MILSFSKQKFVTDIRNFLKIHTIRPDVPDRWQVGRPIEFWYKSPRNVTQNPYHFATGVCSQVDEITIARSFRINKHPLEVRVFVNRKELTDQEILQLMLNDGLKINQFRLWFVPPDDPVFVGRIIHWQDLKLL